MSCPIKLRRETLLRQNNRCSICGHKPWAREDSFHIHRVVPGRLGGKYVSGNTMACCRECHIKIEGLTREEILLLEPYMPPPLGVESNL